MSSATVAETRSPHHQAHCPPHPAGLATWGDAEDESLLVCQAVLDVTHDVKTFTFASPDAHLFHFEPGQFITLRLDIDGTEVLRSYTVSSPPTRPHTLSITVKRKPGGVVSPWLHDTVRPGTALRVQPPLGVFSTSRHPADKYLFLSAGSGITPLMSMTRTLADLGRDADVVFVHSARTPADIIFRKELEALEALHPWLRVQHVVASAGDEPSWSGLTGQLDGPMLTAAVPDYAEREVFVCGPPPYMEAVRAALLAAGLPEAKYHQETFSFERLDLADAPSSSSEGANGELSLDATEVERVADASADSAGAADGASADTETGFAVAFTRSGCTIRCGRDETILEAAFRAGLTPPSSCSEGVCGTCKTTLVDGEVDMQHQGGIRPREIKMGKVLLCCSKPLSDVSVEA
ncbi:Ferredoxin-NADP reductase [Quadrisphaera granulorum]|uniref:Ferredoxin-NADP reductase n=1 Tax=Quadrisphaera granulorum TaxID=317664 RepID=A0A316A914_9ACTN|nr:hybrid-cluster NAD(P)-dependent oxidoreductase [Quadrisphaera granulorum]PWJ54123.1 ferredoxin-NADP reductase [Quadrisphaera granulorum]SZE96262.1 Ferredoxin-NADP reductase [Quadrisphaera granulorum]